MGMGECVFLKRPRRGQATMSMRPSRTPSPSLSFVLLMATMMSVAAISIDAMLPALGQIGQDLGSAFPNQSQLIISAVFVGMGVGQLIAGPISDAVGRKPLLMGCLLLYVLGALICLFASTMTPMLIGRVIQGLGAAGPWVSCVSILRDKFGGREMAKVLSLVMTVFITAPVLAPALGQGLMLLTHWRVIFVFFVVYAVAVGVWALIALDETLPPEKRVPWRVKTIWHGFKEVLAHQATRQYALAMGLVFACFIGYLTSIQQIFQVQYQVGGVFVVYFGLQALGFGVSSLINARFVEQFGMRYIVMRGLFAVVLIGGVVATLSAFFIVPFWIFFTFGLVSLFCIGLLFGNLNALAMEPMGHIAGTAAAIVAAIANVISISLGTLVGQLYAGTLLPVALSFVVLGLLALRLVLSADRVG